MRELADELTRQHVATPYIDQLKDLNGSLEVAMRRVHQLETDAAHRAELSARSRDLDSQAPQSQACVLC